MPDLLEISLQMDKAREDALKAYFAKLPRSVLSMLRLTVVAGMNRMWIWIREEKWTGGTTSDRLKRRSGTLIKSLRKTVKLHQGANPAVEGRLFVAPTSKARAYASTHEYGAVIKPVRAKMLTIPLTDEARRRGSPTRWPKGVLFPVRPGQKSKSFMGQRLTASAGRWLLARKPGGFTKTSAFTGRRLKTAPGQGLIFEYVGKTEVRIPARPAFGPAADTWFPIIADDAERNLAELMDSLPA